MPERSATKRGLHPGPAWRWARRLTQIVAFVAVLIAPFLGGWQRLDRNRLANWDGLGWDLPEFVMARLQIGDASKAAYEFNRVLGGGSSVDYLGVPVVDPVGGSLAMVWTTSPPAAVVIAWLIPVVLGLVAGRIFCGWFCPFGSLSRLLDALLIRVAPRWRRFELPRKRSARFAILAIALLVGALGSQTLLYLLLPHALVQQAAYGVWLMGGGGAALGALLGLLLVGLAFGPSAYCAVICPTGASLALLGHKRIVHLAVVDPCRCGKACDLCDRACWLDLEPSSNPGPDCDLCTRCTELCPHANLAVIVGKPPTRIARTIHATTLSLLVLLGSSCTPETAWREDPRLLLDAAVQADEAELFISVVDQSGVRLDRDDPRPLVGCDVAMYLVRGARPEADEFGKLGKRDVYLGPLVARVYSAEGIEFEALEFTQPNAPISTGWRTIYSRRLPVVLEPGARIELEPIAGWTQSVIVVEVPPPNQSHDPWRMLAHVIAAFACLGGLVALAMAVNAERRR